MQNPPKLEILYHKRALKFLSSISYKQSKQVTDKIKTIQTKEILVKGDLNIKKLEGTKHSYRLRVGKIRVILRMHKKDDVIYVEDIDFRGNIY